MNESAIKNGHRTEEIDVRSAPAVRSSTWIDDLEAMDQDEWNAFCEGLHQEKFGIEAEEAA